MRVKSKRRNNKTKHISRKTKHRFRKTKHRFRKTKNRKLQKLKTRKTRKTRRGGMEGELRRSSRTTKQPVTADEEQQAQEQKEIKHKLARRKERFKLKLKNRNIDRFSRDDEDDDVIIVLNDNHRIKPKRKFVWIRKNNKPVDITPEDAKRHAEGNIQGLIDMISLRDRDFDASPIAKEITSEIGFFIHALPHDTPKEWMRDEYKGELADKILSQVARARGIEVMQLPIEQRESIKLMVNNAVEKMIPEGAFENE
jgi:hypothetical protein